MPLDLPFPFTLPRLFRSPAISNFFSFPLGLRNSGVRLYLNKAASLIVDKVVFNYDSVRRLLDDILTNQESQDETDKQERTVGSRFPCGFPGCQASFKYDVRRGRHVSSLMTHVVNPVSWL